MIVLHVIVFLEGSRETCYVYFLYPVYDSIAHYFHLRGSLNPGDQDDKGPASDKNVIKVIFLDVSRLGCWTYFSILISGPCMDIL